MYRVLRILEYTGESKDIIEAQLQQRHIKGTFITKDITIRESIIGDYPETLHLGSINTKQEG